MIIAMMSQANADQTPVYAWTNSIKGEKVEITGETSSKSISEDIKNILDKTDANSLIVYLRPGMTTQQLNSVLLNNNKIANVLRRSNPKAIERSYTSAVGMSIIDEFKTMFGDATVMTITSQNDLNALKEQIANAPKPFIHKVYLIELPFEQDAVFDDIVSKIEKAFAERTLNNHVSMIAGSANSNVRRLQETDVDPADDESNDDPVVPEIYLTSNILLKNLLVIPLVLLLIVGLLQMFYIKTPTMFVDKGIDFGKIEK
jgi:hypothetical protein